MMSCPDCGADLNDVPVGDPCPKCGGTRRDATVSPGTIEARVSIPTPGILIEPDSLWAISESRVWRSLNLAVVGAGSS